MSSLLLLAFALACEGLAIEDPGALGPAKQTASAWIDANAESLQATSREIWNLAELALKEFRSSELLSKLLESQGFRVQKNVAEMPTAFVASFGEGRPVIAYLAEFDALPGLSQSVAAEVNPVVSGGNGHGCGHNLFGPASVAAGIALKTAMVQHGLKGTVRVYGTPAEEQGIGKVFMVRDGLFTDVDLCLSWHPSSENKVSVQPSKACRSFEITFYGRSAHASAAPWEGVSALDAVEAFTSGLNLLREHIPESARIHYVITEGGRAPNVIPARARIWVYTRGKDWSEEEKLYAHVRRIAEGAELIAWGEEHGLKEKSYRPHEVAMYSGLYDYNINFTAAELLQSNLQEIGAPAYSAEEHAFAKRLQAAFGLAEKGMHTEILPLIKDKAPEPGGSTDVANVSWVTPTVDLNMATWPLGVPAHSWASTAASGSPAGLRAMLSCAKVLACSGVEALSKPEWITEARKEFEAKRKECNYECPVGPKDHPQLPTHLRDEAK